MRAGWLFTLCLLVALLAFVPVAVPAPIGGAADGTGDAAPDAAVATDSWLGGLAAIGCGVMVRATIITAGTQVGTIAGAVACCGYMLLDLALDSN